MAESNDTAEDGAGRRAAARSLAERASRAEAAGDLVTANRLYDEAQRIDPEAVANVLQERTDQPVADTGPASDEDVAAITRQIQPGSDAPSGVGGGSDYE
jgi:hypothetical protein